MFRPPLSRLGSFIAALAFGLPAAAQFCTPGWSGFTLPGPRGPVYALLEHDDGSGNALFVAGYNLTKGGTQPTYHGVMRWRGSTLQGLYPGQAYAMTKFDFGTGPTLVVGGTFATGMAGQGVVDQVLRWTGSAFAPVGIPSPGTTGFGPNSVLALQGFDDGSGPALYAAGTFQKIDNTSVLRVARWNGSAWSQVGAGLNNVAALCVFDDGGGPRLYAAGSFSNSGTTPVSRVARWNGTSWEPAGSSITQIATSLARLRRRDGAEALRRNREHDQLGPTPRRDDVDKCLRLDRARRRAACREPPRRGPTRRRWNVHGDRQHAGGRDRGVRRHFLERARGRPARREHTALLFDRELRSGERTQALRGRHVPLRGHRRRQHTRELGRLRVERRRARDGARRIRHGRRERAIRSRAAPRDRGCVRDRRGDGGASHRGAGRTHVERARNGNGSPTDRDRDVRRWNGTRDLRRRRLRRFRRTDEQLRRTLERFDLAADQHRSHRGRARARRAPRRIGIRSLRGRKHIADRKRPHVARHALGRESMAVDRRRQRRHPFAPLVQRRQRDEALRRG